MDFAEKYTWSYKHEIQSAYFGQQSVTVHPVVIYFRREPKGELLHKSLVFVSDSLKHTSSTVFAIMKKLFLVVQNLVPSLQCVHYVTDSPTSQYRNKDMFFVVSNHQSLFQGVQGTWTYFEAGHGKGPCDGVGASVKRMADSAVTRGTVIIQDASDFFRWGTKQVHSEMSFEFVAKEDCQRSQELLMKHQPPTIPGTMMVHGVVSTEPGTVSVRSTSCFCHSCWNGAEGFSLTCTGWKKWPSKKVTQEGDFETELDINMTEDLCDSDVWAPQLVGTRAEKDQATHAPANSLCEGESSLGSVRTPQRRYAASDETTTAEKKSAELSRDKKPTKKLSRKRQPGLPSVVDRNTQSQKKRRLSRGHVEDDAPCFSCGRMFSEAQGKEKWIQCVLCKEWYHEVCLGFSGKMKPPLKFVCPVCE